MGITTAALIHRRRTRLAALDIRFTTVFEVWRGRTSLCARGLEVRRLFHRVRKRVHMTRVILLFVVAAWAFSTIVSPSKGGYQARADPHEILLVVTAFLFGRRTEG